MSVPLENVLKQLGWDSGFQLPVANAENRLLEEEIARLSLETIKTKNAYKVVENRLDALKKHQKFLLQESEQNQKLLTAHKQQLDEEHRQYRTLVAEKHNTVRDIKDLSKKIEDNKQKCDAKQAELEKRIFKIDKLKAETDWDEAALNAWEESLKKRDEDIELIVKFTGEDERKYNELEAKRYNLQAEHTTRTHTVNKMVCDIQNYELVMERTGKMIKQQVTERDSLISQWKDAVRILQQRDNDIEKAQERLIEFSNIMEKQNDILVEQNKLLKNEKDNNRNMTLEIQDLNVAVSMLRKDYSDLLQTITKITSELGIYKMAVFSSAKNLQNERIKNKRLTESIADQEHKVQKFTQDIAALKVKFTELKGSQSSSVDRIKHLESMVKFEETENDLLLGEMEKMQTVIYRTQQSLKDQEDKQKALDSKMISLKNMLTQLKRRNKIARATLDKNIEIAYEFDYRIGSLEKVLYETDRGEVQEDFEEKEEKIQKLEKTLNDLNETNNFLQDQISKIHEEMRRISTVMALDKNELETLKDKCENQMIFFDIGKKQLISTTDSVHQKQVEENIIRLRIANIEKNVKKEDKSIVSLQKLRLNLDQAMKERQLDINATKTILNAKRRSLEEDRGRMRADISLRQVRLEQYQKKYHIALMNLGKDEEGQPLSITHFKIKNAQEKFFLQQEGDSLNEKIKTAEAEIVAMENTLQVVNMTNKTFRQTLSFVSKNSKEVTDMKALEEEFIKINFKLNNNRVKFVQQKQLLQELENKLKEMHMRKNEVRQNLLQYQKEYMVIKKQKDDKLEKLERAECQLKKILKQISKKRIEKFDRDFEIRRFRDGNKVVLHKLTQMSNEYQDVSPKIRLYAVQYHVQLPSGEVSPTISSETSLTLASSRSICSNDSSFGSKKSQNIATVTLSLDI